MLEQVLIERAKNASAKAYCPYSHFAVGACVLTAGDKLYDGCNIENRSYSLTQCAERNAICKAVGDGECVIKAVCVYSQSRVMPYPCGACLQVIAEFCDDADIIVTNGISVEKYKLSELLTKRF